MAHSLGHTGAQAVHVRQRSSCFNIQSHGTQIWVDRIQEAWRTYGKTRETINLLSNYFEAFRSDAPYSALLAAANTNDFYWTKNNTLSVFIMGCFCEWKKNNEIPLTSDAILLEAFDLISEHKNATLTKHTIEAFDMKYRNQLFINQIHDMCSRSVFKEACQIAVALGLFHEFDVEEFVVPLIFQDKFSVAEEYLKANQDCQVALAKYLDTLMGAKNRNQEVQRIITQKNIINPKLDKLSPKPLHKLLKKIIKMYRIPEEECPNFRWRVSYSALQFLLRKRYVDKEIGGESWEDMVMEYVKNERKLQMELLTSLCNYGEHDEYIKWATRFNIPTDILPIAELRKLRPSGQPSSPPKDESMTNPMPIRTLDTHTTSINFIDNSFELNRFLALYADEITVCGFDLEWKPVMGVQRVELSLMQIAIRNKVFIIDVLTLIGDVTNRPQWEILMRKIFFNDNVLKIGFALENDFAVLGDTYSFLGGYPSGTSRSSSSSGGFLDLRLLWTNLNANEYKFRFEEEVQKYSKSRGLAKLVELTLGETLDKSNQLSNWERRPLRPCQINYAASDAHCLLDVFNALSSSAERQRIPFSYLVELSMTETENMRKRKWISGKRFGSRLRPMGKDGAQSTTQYLKYIAVTVAVAGLSWMWLRKTS